MDASVVPGLRRKADIVFTKARLAVFIDGCFWHGCPDHYVPSKTNANFWAEKIAANRERDRDTDSRLRNAGWHVSRHWSHERPEIVAAAVLRQVGFDPVTQQL